jgi:hypothetical protein
MEEKESTPKYHVYDRQTGERANKTEYKNRAGARRAVDRLDNEYGGYRYQVKPAETSTGGGRGGMGGGGGGMNPIDLERLPGKRPLKMKAGGSVKSRPLNEPMVLQKKVKLVEKWSDVFNKQHSVF